MVETEFLFVVPFMLVEGNMLGDAVAGEGVGLGVRGVVPVSEEEGDVEEVAWSVLVNCRSMGILGGGRVNTKFAEWYIACGHAGKD